MSTILQEFINSHLTEVKPNDEEFNKLKEAATSLSKSEFRKKENVIKYTLAAFDPDIPASEPVLLKAKEHVEKQSPTVLTQSGDLPRTTLRAVILEALYTRALNDLDYARIVWHTANKIIGFYSLGNEEEVLYGLLDEIGEKVEQEALKEWSLVDNNSLEEAEQFNIQAQKLEGLQTELESFKESFKNSIQNSAWGGENPYRPHGQDQNWMNHFSQHGGQSILKIVNKAVELNNKNLNNFKQKFNEYLVNLKPYLEKAGQEAAKGVKSVNNRSQLLLWKEALYSPGLKKSYREVSSELLPLIMAYDLYTMITQIYPVSIDYFLKETIKRILPKDGEISFDKFLKELNRVDNKPFVADFIPKAFLPKGRISLLMYISSMLNGDINGAKTFKSRLGIDNKNEIHLSELAVWLFHDLQALRLASK